MKIRLLNDWMGNRRGAHLNLIDRVARELISRGTAIEKKQVGRPPKDKMIRQSINK